MSSIAISPIPNQQLFATCTKRYQHFHSIPKFLVTLHRDHESDSQNPPAKLQNPTQEVPD
ncbi:hypothetical protein V1478_016341 [Vespula squamosa]|uniref:Uncharacterized protein n=1 Tax=Vespula squamosa TaxID=30214 RepID=A0ABD1ZZI9_VESSQ